MRIFAISDLHIDYEENRQWVRGISSEDYTEDILILAGDVSDRLKLKAEAFKILSNNFHQVIYVPGNHDLWVYRDPVGNSLEKYEKIMEIACDFGILTSPIHLENLSIIPLLGWYDYSFGEPVQNLVNRWSDFSVCRWPGNFNEKKIHNYFITRNLGFLDIKNDFIITFSHFLPRADLIPQYVPLAVKELLPVMGSETMGDHVRQLKPDIHVYGHSHLNRKVMKEKTLYINNAFGYPYETRITAKKLVCIHER